MVSGEMKRDRSILETLAWGSFCLTCIQLGFLRPYIVMFPGERTNVFSGTLCAVTLILCLAAALRGRTKISGAELLVSVVLLFLALASAVHSSTPLSSSLRAMVLVATGLGGFWCARILLNSPSRQQMFKWLCVAILSGVLCLAIIGYFLGGRVDYYLYTNPHPIINVVFLLSFAPLSLLRSKVRWMVLLGALLLLLCWVVGLLAGLRGTTSGILVPLGMAVVAAFVFAGRAKSFVPVWILLFIVSGAGVYSVYQFSPDRFGQPGYQSLRFEAYPFSWHVAKKNPLLGIGLRTPREEYLDDYQIHHPALKKDLFRKIVKRDVTPENTFLCLLTGLGFPFFLMYTAALLYLLLTLVRSLSKRPEDSRLLDSVTLLLPISGSLMHSMTTDTFLLPQVNWFFHILIGLIPRPVAVPVGPVLPRKTLALRVGASLIAVCLGAFIGTHPAFAPERLSSQEGGIVSQLEGLPLVRLLLSKDVGVEGKKSEPKDASSSAEIAPGATDQRIGTGSKPPGSTSEHARRVPQAVLAAKKSTPGRERKLPKGSLTVNIDGYVGEPVRWAVSVILDNSESMALRIDPWKDSRTQFAVEFVEKLSRSLGPDSQIALRAFSGGHFLKLGKRALNLRVSRLFADWTLASSFHLSETGREALSLAGRNNPCAAVAHSLRSDFRGLQGLTPRCMVITDCRTKCAAQTILKEIKASVKERDVKVDVVALGVGRGETERSSYLRLARATGGIFLSLENPGDMQAAMDEYMKTVLRPRPGKITISGAGQRYESLPGKEIRLPPGKYMVTLPEMKGLSASSRSIENVRVVPGGTSCLQVSVGGGKLHVRSIQK